MPKWPFEEVPDPTGMTDADWADLNKLKAAYESGGAKASRKVFAELSADPVRGVRILGALFPEMVREQLKDRLAEHGITEDDLRQMLREAERREESPSSKKH
jgi:hypothetical protein